VVYLLNRVLIAYIVGGVGKASH